jgi:hypothetical protein
MNFWLRTLSELLPQVLYSIRSERTISQQKRKPIEQGFGWVKTVGECVK